jgi:hypothetical protein
MPPSFSRTAGAVRHAQVKATGRMEIAAALALERIIREQKSNAN